MLCYPKLKLACNIRIDSNGKNNPCKKCVGIAHLVIFFATFLHLPSELFNLPPNVVPFLFHGGLFVVFFGLVTATITQVWSLAQFYFVGFLKSRLIVEKGVFCKRTFQVRDSSS